MSEACGNCRFSNTGAMSIDGVHVAAALVCRRFPPTVTSILERGSWRPTTNVPPVHATDWCGEWQARP